MIYPCFPLRRAFLLLLLLSQFTHFLLSQEANTCVNCALIPTYLHIALVILLYIDNHPWDIHVTSWKQPLKLNLPLCCSNAFTLNLLLYELTPMQVLLMLVLKVLFMKSLCYMIQLFIHCLYHCFESLHSSHMLYNSIDQDYDSMSLQKLSLLSFTYSGREGTKLGDADTSPTYR